MKSFTETDKPEPDELQRATSLRTSNRDITYYADDYVTKPNVDNVPPVPLSVQTIMTFDHQEDEEPPRFNMVKSKSQPQVHTNEDQKADEEIHDLEKAF